MSKVRILIGRKRQRLLLHTQERTELAPPIVTLPACGKAPAERPRPLVQNRVGICARRTIKIELRSAPIRVDGPGRLDNLDIEQHAERRDAADNPRALDDVCRRQEISELGQAEGGQDG